MPTDGVVADTSPEHVPTAHQLVGEGLRVLEDLALECGIERLGQRVVRAGTDRAHRLAQPQAATGVLKSPGRVDTAVVRVKDRTGETGA